MDHSAKMPRSFLIKKNYSHCPLKKRPVVKLDDEKDVSDNSEPENLSTKPQDLSMSSQHPPAQHHSHQLVHKASPTAPAASLVAALKREPLTSAPAALNAPCGPPPSALASPPPPPPHPAFPVAAKHQPLEPLNLNTPPAEPVAPTTLHPASAYGSPPPPWPTHYPSPYFAFNYPYPPAELYPHHPYPPAVLYPLSPARSPLRDQLSPYAPRDSPSSSPPLFQHASAPIHAPTAAPAPKLYSPWQDGCGLSPTSSVASSASHVSSLAFRGASPPPATPEDLSSPGSVSSGASSAGSTSAGSGKKKTTAAPRYQCTGCAKSYSTYSGLSKHQQFHCESAGGAAQAKKSFSCKNCGKVYVTLGGLKMHIRTHTLPCKCHLCGKAFSRPWLLQGHIRTHTGEKPFSCPHCKRAFADRSNLRAHLQTHSDVKKYSCASCSKTFSRMSLLTKHTEGGCPGVAGTLVEPVHGHVHAQVHDFKAYE